MLRDRHVSLAVPHTAEVRPSRTVPAVTAVVASAGLYVCSSAERSGLSLLARALCVIGLTALGYALARLFELRAELALDRQERERVTRELVTTRAELASKVEERTRDLARANAALKAEVADRKESQEVQARLLEERLALEQQLLKAQKMEAIGRLAGGVAHDFNNLLTAIIGFAEIAALQKGQSQLEAIAQIQKASARASELTRALLAFARQQPMHASIVDPNQVILSAERLLERLIGEDISLSLSLSENGWPVKIDAAQLEQVIINLSVNARDAMPAGGSLLISSQNVRDGLQELLRIRVSDTGVGMDEATSARLFEPFFTTKAEGRGTGLGLATSYGIVAQAGGRIRVHSVQGIGTTFEIDLPRAHGGALLTKLETVSREIPRGRERVLVVEDEPLVRAIIEVTLMDHGYQVLSADSAARAIELARTYRDIQLVVTDVILPEKNGQELVQVLRTLVPAIAVLYMSGYTPETISERGVLTDDGAFLEKPFAPQTLVHSVRAALDGAPQMGRAIAHA